MAQSAFQIQYRQEYVKGFEQRQSLLRNTTTMDAVYQGQQAVFLVADSGGAVATTRGLNGKIASRSDNLNQFACTLVEYHDKVERTGFNLFASQGDGKRIMMDTSMAVINRRIDSLILTELATATQDTGASNTNVRDMMLRAKTILGQNYVPYDGNITAIISPAFEANLLKIPEFTNSFYVNGKPYETAGAAWADKVKSYNWLGVNLIVDPQVPGMGTATESCFLFHKSAIGSAANTGDMQVYSGYNEEDDYNFVRSSIYMGAKLLQNSGVVVMNHDASAYIAE